MVALEVFFLKLKLFIHTGIAGGIFTLKLQQKKTALTGGLTILICLNDYFQQSTLSSERPIFAALK